MLPLSKTAAIESNSNPLFVIAVFELLKEKTLSRTTVFATINPTWPSRTSLGISLAEKLNSSFFPLQTLFKSQTLAMPPLNFFGKKIPLVIKVI